MFKQLVVFNRAVDGRKETNYKYETCTHTKDSHSPWLVIDLQGNYSVTYVKILNREDCCGKYIFIVDIAIKRFHKSLNVWFNV